MKMHHSFRRIAIATAVAVLGVAPSFVSPSEAASKRSTSVRVIVTATPGTAANLRQTVKTAGGRVERTLPIVHGVSAVVPVSAITTLRSAKGVTGVTVDARLSPQSVLPGTSYEQTSTTNSIYSTTLITGAQEYWKRGFTGAGVDVAVIDTGVLVQNGLNGRVVNGPDLSFESQDVNRRYKDSYGHGTHMAGIIAGRDDGVTSYVGNSSAFIGMAPDARIVNVKVGDGNGVTDVSQVIAAVDWIVQNKNSNGLNIKVIELAYATDSLQDYTVSPLTHALEVAWQKGITVVVAAGNDGKASGLAFPATDPLVLSVGAADTKGTLSSADDGVANFSSTGKQAWTGRGPDVVAPGVSIPSLRVPGGKVDSEFPTARLGSRFFKGSGTSQASAVVAGAVALIAQERPNATPDQIKGVLKQHAQWLANESNGTMGQGEINLAWILGIFGTGFPEKPSPRATGTGSLDQARGTRRPTLNGVALVGEKDVLGGAYSAPALATARTAGGTWSGGRWNGSTWTGGTWSGSTWTGATWSGATWSGSTWSGSTWTGSTWTGSTWTGSVWSTGGWG